MAGARAIATYAHEEALGHFERALAAKEGEPADVETAELHSGLFRAQLAAFEIDEAVQSLRRAFDCYVEVGDLASAVAVVEYPHSAEIVRQAPDLLEQAIAFVPKDSPQTANLLSTYGFAIGQDRDKHDSAN